MSDVVLEFFDVSLSITQTDVGMNLLGYPLLGKLATRINVFHLGIIFLTVQ